MKKNMVILMALFFTGNMAFAQGVSIPTTWKISKIGVSYGTEQDMINDLNYEYLLQTSEGLDPDFIDQFDMEEKAPYSGVCENAHMRLTAFMGVPGLKNTDLQLSAVGIFNRYDGATYDNYNYDLNEVNETTEYITFGSWSQEIDVEASLTRRVPVTRFVNLYGGAGSNLGVSFGGYSNVHGTRSEQIEMNENRSVGDITRGRVEQTSVFDEGRGKSGFHQRVFAQAGIGVVFFKRLELGFDYRGGIGYKAISGAPTKMTKLKSFGMSARWILKS